MKTSNIKLYFGALSLALMASCKAPQATVAESAVPKSLPEAFENQPQQESATNSALVPWREFFTDPNLVSLIEEGLAHNQDLLKTLKDIDIARSNVLYRSGRLLPTVNVEGGAGLRKAGRYTSEGAGDASTSIVNDRETPDPLPNLNLGLAADWEVDIWKKLRDEKASAVAHYLGTVEGKNFVYTNLISEIASNYYELLALDNKLQVMENYIKLQKQALEISKVQKEAMAGTELGVKKFEAELAKASASVYTIRQEITEKENNINGLLGRLPQPIQRDSNTLMAAIPAVVKTGVPTDLLSNRPDIRQAEQELTAAKLDVSAARKEFYPKLNISAALGLEAFSPAYFLKVPQSIASNILGSAVAPLINKSAIQANFNTADARQLQALYDYDKTIINAYLETANSLSKIDNLQKYYLLKKDENTALTKAIDAAHQLFLNSRADYLEVLMNQRDALDARLELVEAKQMQLTATIMLYKELGGGWR